VVKKKADPKGYSLFWRKDRKRWCLTFPGPGGWDDPIRKLAPADMGKRDRKRADAWAVLYIQNAEQLELFPRARPNGITLRVRVEQWKKIRRDDPRTAPSTLQGYADVFKNVIMKPFKVERASHCLGEEDVISLGTDFSLLRKWIRAVAKQHSPSRVRNAFFALRVFYDDAVVERWFRGANPLRNDALVRELPELPTAKERGGVVHTDGATLQALLASSAVPLRRRVRYVVGTTTGGCRDGELAGLTWGRLELEDEALARVEIAQARRLVRAKDEVLGKTKTKTSNRIVPLHPAARAALLEWRDDELDGVSVLLGRRPLPSDPVFPSARARDRGAFARPASASLLREDLEAAGLPTHVRGKPLTFHALRKTFGNWLYEVDCDELTRKRLLGHGSGDVTAEFYTGEAFRKMATAVGALPVSWPTGVRYEPPRAALTPTAHPPRVRPGTLTERILELARARPGLSSGAIARVLGSKVGTTATTLSELRRAGLVPRLPPATGPGVVPSGTAAPAKACHVVEPPSRIELETYGLRNPAAKRASTPVRAADRTKTASTSLQGNGENVVNGDAEELLPDAGRVASSAPSNEAEKQAIGATSPPPHRLDGDSVLSAPRDRAPRDRAPRPQARERDHTFEAPGVARAKPGLPVEDAAPARRRGGLR